MKKRDFLLAGSLLFGLSLNVSAQEQLFFFGFEDGDKSFTDSTNPLDSIVQLQYYSHSGSNGSGMKPEEWELGPVVDTLIYELNGFAPLKSRGDSYSLIVDSEGGHANEFAKMGAEGGTTFFTYTAGGEVGGSACNDYEANLFIRGLKIEDNTSYRLTMYTKASRAEGQLTIDLMRGSYNSEKPFSMNGASGSGEFRLDLTTFETERWERVNLMSYYQNDSVANRYMFQAGYWWTNSWAKTIGEDTYNLIQQPDKYFVRLSFRGPGVTYYVDDISLRKSWIAGAEYNGEIMRIDFGYDTNLKELAQASPLSSIKLPGEYFKVYGRDTGTDVYGELPVRVAEYQSDGYLYMWLDEDEDFGYYDSVSVDFINPEDAALQLKYDGDLYPMSLDTLWVQAGKIVPGFSGEPAFYNPEVYATSQEAMPPVYVSSNPEDGSFNLPSTTTSFSVTFNKKPFVKLDAQEDEQKSVVAVVSGSGIEEIWLPSAFDDETNTVTFSRQSKHTTALVGDYEFRITQLRATAGAGQGDDKVLTLSFGEANVAPKIFARENFTSFDKGTRTIDGFAVNASCMMEVTEFTGAYSKALKFGLYGENLQNGAPILTYTVEVPEAGEWLVKYGTSGCNKGSWNDGCKMEVRVINEATSDTLDIYEEGGTNNRPDEGGNVSKADDIVRTVNFASAGTYVIEFKLPNENSYGGGHKGGRVLYYVEVSNKYSSAYKYVEKYNNALAAAQAIVDKSEASIAIYGGEGFVAFKNRVTTEFAESGFANFSSTSPTAYDAIVADINAATAVVVDRIAKVDDYYKSYNSALDMDTLYKDSASYNTLVAFLALKDTIAAYAELDITKKSTDDVVAIKGNVDAAMKAMSDRCAAIDAFTQNIDDADNAFIDCAQYSALAEFKSLQETYNTHKDLNLFTSTDDELKAANDALNASLTALNGKVTAARTLTAQISGLKEMAEALEVEWGTVDAEALAAQVEKEVEDNQDIANVYQLAIKAKLEKLMSAGSVDFLADESMDMSYFIQNKDIYTQGTKSKVVDNEDPIPGWAVSNIRGNVYFGLPWNNQAASASKPAVNSWLGLDWNSGLVMQQSIENLPAGLYTIESGFSSKNAQGSLLIEQFDGEGEMIASDTLTWTSSSELMGEASLNQSATVELQGGKVVLTADAFSSGSWGGFDKWALSLIEPLRGYDYAAAAAASASALTESYTGVAAVLAPVKVQYFNLNGMESSDPSTGVNIRITTGKNGERRVEKILVK